MFDMVRAIKKHGIPMIRSAECHDVASPDGCSIRLPHSSLKDAERVEHLCHGIRNGPQARAMIPFRESADPKWMEMQSCRGQVWAMRRWPEAGKICSYDDPQQTATTRLKPDMQRLPKPSVDGV